MARFQRPIPSPRRPSWSRLPAILAAAGVIGGSPPARSAPQETVLDCAAPADPADHAICADPTLRTLRQRVDALYAQVMRGLDLGAQALLQDDEASATQARDQHYQIDRTSLRHDLEQRIRLLDGIDPRRRPGRDGAWENLLGYVLITQDRAGSYWVAIETVTPTADHATCRFSARATIVAGVILAGRNPADLAKTGGWSIRLTRRGAALAAELVPPAGAKPTTPPPFCEPAGIVDAVFLPVRERPIGKWR